MARTRVLVANNDMDILSRIYLALIHRNFKAEACNIVTEISERIKRMKPAVVILDHAGYLSVKDRLKIPAIILLNRQESHDVQEDPETKVLYHPLQMDTLMQAVQQLVI